jgi:hypothetical protein
MKTINEAEAALRQSLFGYRWFRFIGINQKEKMLIVYVKEDQGMIAENVVSQSYEGYKVIVKEIGDIVSS